MRPMGSWAVYTKQGYDRPLHSVSFFLMFILLFFPPFLFFNCIVYLSPSKTSVL